MADRIERARRWLARTVSAVRSEARRVMAGHGDTYCPRCDSCGEDGCCPAEHCDNGPLCAGYYGNRDQRHELIGHRKGWSECWAHFDEQQHAPAAEPRDEGEVSDE